MDPLSIETIGGREAENPFRDVDRAGKATGNKKRQIACKTDHLLPFAVRRSSAKTGEVNF